MGQDFNLRHFLKQALRYFKLRFVPKSLLVRSLLILVIPLIVLQVVTAYIFFERHWETVGRRLAYNLAGDIATVSDLLNRFPEEENLIWITKLSAQRMQMRITLLNGAKIPEQPLPLPRGVMAQPLDFALDELLRVPFLVSGSGDERHVNVFLQKEDGVLQVTIPSKRFFSATTYLFMLWMIGTSLLLFVVATLFMRNQVRPVYRLAEAADMFGKGREVEKFKPEGASEVRKAAQAFIIMRNRIKRQINERTNMLAGVSHDLRTPLTRMKLQLAMMEGVEGVLDLRQDVTEMEGMVEGYLAFARGETGEKAVNCNLSQMISEIVERFIKNGAQITLKQESDVSLPLKPMAFSRCFSNLIGNAVRYADEMEVSMRKEGENVEVVIDDDGPGIPFEKRDDVFKAFYRLESSRNQETGGVGLGLTIARDIMNNHGGDIILDDSPLGGLRVILLLPI